MSNSGDFRQQSLDLLHQLHVAVLRFDLSFTEPIYLPNQYAKTLRGGIGTIFKRLVCVQPQVLYCRECVLVQACAYPSVFETPIPPELENQPYLQEVTPFVIRNSGVGSAHRSLGDRQPAAGLSFRILLYGRAITLLPYFVIALRQMGERHGFGRRRTRFQLQQVVDETPDFMPRLLYHADNDEVNLRTRQTTLGRLVAGIPAEEEIERVHIVLKTPLRLKAGGRIAALPTFDLFIAALHRRLTQLVLIHEGAAVPELSNLVEHARNIDLVEHHLEAAPWSRYSSRQKQRIWMGGVVGDLVFAGELGPFLPLLWGGQLVHVGKGSAFGNGQYAVGAVA